MAGWSAPDVFRVCCEVVGFVGGPGGPIDGREMGCFPRARRPEGGVSVNILEDVGGYGYVRTLVAVMIVEVEWMMMFFFSFADQGEKHTFTEITFFTLILCMVNIVNLGGQSMHRPFAS